MILLLLRLLLFCHCEERELVEIVSPANCETLSAAASLQLVVRDQRNDSNSSTVLISIQNASSTWNYDIPVSE